MTDNATCEAQMSDDTTTVYCRCGAQVYDLDVRDDGSVWEPDDTHCPDCGARVYARIYDGIINFYCDDGEVEGICDVDWPEWAVRKYDRRREAV